MMSRVQPLALITAASIFLGFGFHHWLLIALIPVGAIWFAADIYRA